MDVVRDGAEGRLAGASSGAQPFGEEYCRRSDTESVHHSIEIIHCAARASTTTSPATPVKLHKPLDWFYILT